MKRLYISIIMFLIPLAVFAHPGRTDSQGGHHDRATGEYHYHHGMSAHQHPGGVCPYQNTYTSTAVNDKYIETITAEYGGGYSDEYGIEYDYGYEDGYDYGLEVGQDEGYDEGYAEGYDAGIQDNDAYYEGHDDGYENGFADGKMAYENAPVKRFWFLIPLLIGFIIYICVIKGSLTNKENEVKKLKEELEKTQDSKAKNVVATQPQKKTAIIPTGYTVGSDGLPYKNNKKYGWGREFNVFVTNNGTHFHRSKCRIIDGGTKNLMHRYTAIFKKYTPCAHCKPKGYIDEWYIEYKGADKGREQLSFKE